MEDPWGNLRAGFLATTDIDRENFDIIGGLGGVRNDRPRDVVSLIAALQRSATAYSV